MRKSQHGYYDRIYNTIPRSSWVGTEKLLSQLSYTHRYPLTKRAGFAFSRSHDRLQGQAISTRCSVGLPRFNLIEQAETTVTNPPERNGTLDCSDARTGDCNQTRRRHIDRPSLSRGSCARWGKPHAAPFERTDKLATGELLFNTKEKQK